MVGMTLKSRCITPPRCHTLLGEMANMTTIVACAWNHAPLLWWWWVQHGRWGCRSSRNNILMRWWIDSQLMMMLQRWVVMWSTHHLVLVRSTGRRGCQSLLLAFSMSTNDIIHNTALLTSSKKVQPVLSARCS
jgi:hypothetical protein